MKKAFTLVELLVVVAIIALLMAILIPALGMGTELAKRIKCGSNMKNLGVALNLYTSRFKGKLPPCLYQTSGTPKNLLPPDSTNSPFSTMYLLTNFSRNESLTPKERFDGADKRNLGYLYLTKLIKEPEIFYCPSAPKAKGEIVDIPTLPYSYDDYYDDAHPWPWTPQFHGNLVRSSYEYMPQHATRKQNDSDALENFDGGLEIRYPLIAQDVADLAPDKMLLVDILHRLEMLSHKTGFLGRGRGINMMFSDFSVSFVKNERAFREDFLWADIPSGDGLGNYEDEFRYVVKLLEESR